MSEQGVQEGTEHSPLRGRRVEDQSGGCAITAEPSPQSEVLSALEQVFIKDTHSTEELWSSVSDHQVLDHLPDQDPSPQIVTLKVVQCNSNI